MPALLPVALWIDSHLRRLNAEGKGYYIVQKGAYASGAVYLKIAHLDGTAQLLTRISSLEGTLDWSPITRNDRVEEKEADEAIQRIIGRDPDAWVIEIEDKTGTNPFTNTKTEE